MLYIKSTNAASYITVKTGIVADVIPHEEPGGWRKNYFAFSKDDDGVMEAFDEYRFAMKNNIPLRGDIGAFITQFGYYRKESNRVTRQDREAGI